MSTPFEPPPVSRPWHHVVDESRALLEALESERCLTEPLFHRAVQLLRDGTRAGEQADVEVHRHRLRDVLRFWAGYLHTTTQYTVLAPEPAPFTGERRYTRELPPPLALELLLSTTPVQDTLIEGAQWIGVTIDKMRLENCHLAASTLSEVRLGTGPDLSLTSLNECRLHDITSYRLIGKECFLQNVQVEGGDYRKADLSWSILNDVAISDGAVFAGAQFTNAYLGDTRDKRENTLDTDRRLYEAPTVFRGCNFEGASFAAAGLRGAKFENCILRRADFRQADTERCSFPGCDVTGARADSQAMNAAALSPDQQKTMMLDEVTLVLEP
jgi:uncharacterized protein YjbI with pentapeptide repeats